MLKNSLTVSANFGTFSMKLEYIEKEGERL